MKAQRRGRIPQSKKPADAGFEIEMAVVPAHAGTQCLHKSLGPRFRGGDGPAQISSYSGSVRNSANDSDVDICSKISAARS